MPISPFLRAFTGHVVAALALATPPLAAQQPMTLQQAISQAQQQGYQAKAAEASREAARYRDRAFYSRLLPQIGLEGTLPDYNRSIIPVLQPDGTTIFRPQNQTSASLTATMSQTLPLIGGDFFISSSLASLKVTGEETTRTWSSTPISVGLRQPLFRPNVAGWDRREQPVRYEVTERQYREAREDIALQTATLFFDVYAAQVQLQNTATNAAVNDTIFTLNKGRYQVGRIGENDLLQSELALLRARTALDGARLEHQRTLAALRLAMNLPIGAPLEIDGSVVIPRVEADTVVAVAQALRNRASISEAELQEVQAERRVTEARLNNGFGATLLATYGLNATAPEASLVYSNLLEAQRFSFSVQVPLMQWGVRKETVRAAEADRERVANTSRSTIEQTRQDAHFAALQLAQAQRTLALSITADSVAGKRFEVAYNRYVIGRITIDNLFIAQNEKDQARNQFVQALRGYWQAYYRLRRVTLYDFETGQPIQ
ncbi:MAG TPA: TolC family protein [Gemmatimonadales bacterium]